MKWFRLYDELLDDPKAQRLDPVTFKFWVNFLCLANRGEARGVVSRSVGDIAFALRVSDAEAESAIEALVKAGLIERCETGLTPHNWNGRQYKSDDVTARVNEHRNKGNVSQAGEETLHETLHATLPETLKPSARDRVQSTDTDTEAEPEREPAPAGASDGADAPPTLDEPVVPDEVPTEAPKRRRRLPGDFVPSAALTTWAEQDLRLDPVTIEYETEKFCDHFRGSGATKLDWPLTWKNWMRRAAEGTFSRGRASPGKATNSPGNLSNEDLLDIIEGRVAI